jgi:hypothetical protein
MYLCAYLEEGAVMIHKFSRGQTVRFRGGNGYKNTAAGAYTVVRQMPYGEGDCQYCIKSPREQHERVAKESDLELI